MRPTTVACLFILSAATAEARHLTPGVAFTATLQSNTTGATASMTWRTRHTCSQFQLLGFRCLGTWTCEGAACPGRRGILAYIVDRARYDQVMLWASHRPTCFTLPLPSSDPPPQQPPFHWRYFCGFSSSMLTDSGTVLVELKP